jgi:hypothetical protein
MDKFLDAWQDSNFFMVATQEPAPSHLPEMFNFDYDAGHLEYVNGMPYDQFLDLEDQPELWDELLTSPPDEETLDDALLDEGDAAPDASPEPQEHDLFAAPEDDPNAGGDYEIVDPSLDPHAAPDSPEDPATDGETDLFD